MFFSFKNSINLNFNLYILLLEETILNSSEEMLFSKFLEALESIIPEEISVKQRGGNKLQHQFSPLASPIFILIPS